MRKEVEKKCQGELSGIASSIGLFRLVSLKQEFPNNFHQLLHPLTGKVQKTEFNLESKHFPYFIADKHPTLLPSAKVKVFLKPRPGRKIETKGWSL
jgi:hypothetical protein